ELESRGIIVQSLTREGLTEEKPEAYKDIESVVDVVHNVGLAARVARLKPIGVIKGSPERIKKMTLQEKIQSHLSDAMRSKDQLRLSVLRMMKTAVKNKEIEKMKPLEETEVIAVLNTLVKQRKDSVEQFRKGSREELARKEEAEIKIIEEYLPAAASDDEIRRAVGEAVQETGAT